MRKSIFNHFSQTLYNIIRISVIGDKEISSQKLSVFTTIGIFKSKLPFEEKGNETSCIYDKISTDGLLKDKNFLY